MKTQIKLIATLTILFNLTSSAILAAVYTTQADGDWNNSSNWVSGNIPPGNQNDTDMRINHDITLDGSMLFNKNNPKLTLGADVTFLVTGDLTFNNKLELTIPEGSMLVIGGNLTVKNGMSANIDGDLVVLGDFDAGNNTDVTIEGDGNMVVAGEYSIGTGNFNGSGSLYVFDDDPECKTSGDCDGNIANYYTSMDDLQNNNPGLFDIVNNGTLPIQLLYFKATAQKGASEMSWATETEENFDYFVIERSIDGKTFQDIGKVKGAGWSRETRTYGFTDNNPATGVNYYRLKAVDFDGYTEYFPVISTNIENTKIEVNTKASKGMLTISSNVAAHITLLNLQGAPVFESEINAGHNSINLPSSIYKGVYVAVIYNTEQVIGKEKIYVE